MVRRLANVALLLVLLFPAWLVSVPPAFAQSISDPTTSTATQSSGTSVVPAAPAGVDADDVLLAMVTTYDSQTITVTPVDSGWQSLGFVVVDAPAEDHRQYLFYRVGVPSSYQFDFSASAFGVAIILAYDGVDNTMPIDAAVTTNSGNSNTRIGLSVTTVTPGARLVLLSPGWNEVPALPSGMTLRASAVGDVSRAWDQTIAAAGATGNRTSTQATTDAWTTQMVALRPASATPTNTPTSTDTSTNTPTVTNTPTSTEIPTVTPTLAPFVCAPPNTSFHSYIPSPGSIVGADYPRNFYIYVAAGGPVTVVQHFVTLSLGGTPDRVAISENLTLTGTGALAVCMDLPPTSTPTNTGTATATPTDTPTGTLEPTAIPTDTATATATATATEFVLVTPTYTPTIPVPTQDIEIYLAQINARDRQTAQLSLFGITSVIGLLVFLFFRFRA